MELLDKLALPVSGDHLNLLRYLLVLAMSMLVVYSGLLYGSLFSSMYYSSKSNNDSRYAKLAKDIIDLITNAPLIWFALGIAPFIAIILIYTQLLHTIDNSVASYMIFSFFFYCAGIASAYYYKQSIYVSKIADMVSDDNVKEGKLGDFLENTGAVVTSSRLFGIIFLTVAMWLLFGATSSAISPATWEANIFQSMFSLLTIFKFASFVALSFLLVGITFVYINYAWSDNRVNDNKNEYEIFAKKEMSNLALTSILFLPVVYALSLSYVPKESISVTMFGAGMLALVLFLVSIHFVYTTLKEGAAKYLSLGFWLVLFAVLFMNAQDQIAFSVSTEANVVKLADAYEKAHAHGEGDVVVAISGEEIYKTRCSACHKFDVKQVTAPAYNEVLPKYIGNEQNMIKFVLNPYPINKTDYPAGMANQGLKPNEAKAVVEYLLGEVKKNTGK